MRARAAAVTIGPISASLAKPSLILSVSAFSRSRATTSSAMSPTSSATEIAMQRSPAEP